MSVHVGQKPRLHRYVAAPEGQCLGRHQWPEVGPADADRQHMGKAGTGCSDLGARMHGGHEVPHTHTFGGSRGAGVLGLTGELSAQPRIGRRPQRHVHRRSVFGRIDHRAGEHAAAEIVQPGSVGERQ